MPALATTPDAGPVPASTPDTGPTRPTRSGPRGRLLRALLLGVLVAALSSCAQLAEVVPVIDPAAVVPEPGVLPLSRPPVALLSTQGTFVGDGFQHGADGTATQNVIRDAGSPTVMPDGYTLQVFADTVSVPGYAPFYFMTNSAALSPPGGAGTTLEATVGGKPKGLLPWTSAEAAATVNGVRYWGIWPSGVTWIPTGVTGGNRAIITYSRVWVDLSTNPITFDVRGQGIAEYAYPGASAAISQGIQATRLNDDLFPGDTGLEMASPVYANGWVYFYGCSAQTIQCFSARATPANVANPSAWLWWGGTSFNATKATKRNIGVGEFSGLHVQWVPQLKAYAMVNGRGGDELYVRWAASPSGPWTAPQVVTVPGCGPSIFEGGCYGVSIRPESTLSALQVTYAAYGQSRIRLATIPVRPQPRT